MGIRGGVSLGLLVSALHLTLPPRGAHHLRDNPSVAVHSDGKVIKGMAP